MTALIEDQGFAISGPTTGLRAVVVEGDQYRGLSDGQFPGDDTVEGKDRTEIQSLRHLEYGRQFTFSFEFRIADNTPNDNGVLAFTQNASPLILFQLHQKSEDGSASESFSPPVALKLYGNRLWLEYESSSGASGTGTLDNGWGFSDIVMTAGNWVSVSLTVRFAEAPGAAGAISGSITLRNADGVQIGYPTTIDFPTVLP